MPVIDEEGRIFGVINVIDALVVLLVVAVAVAGIALVTGGSSAPGGAETSTETRYVTVDFGTQPEYVVERLDDGDTANLDDQLENATITDTYVSPGENGVRTVARVAVTGRADGDEFTYDGAPLRLGRAISFETSSYAMNGTVSAMGESSDLATGAVPVLVSDVVDDETASELSSGDTYRIAGRDIATIENVSVYGTGNASEKRVFVGLTVQTLEESRERRFGGQRIQDIGAVPFRTETYGFDGTVVRVGALEQRGEPATRSVTLEMRHVPPDMAASLESGMAERVREETAARLTNVTVEPATVVLTSESGEIFEREHPTNKTVTLTAELRVRETDDQILFKGRILQHGNAITLDLGTTTIRAEVVGLESR